MFNDLTSKLVTQEKEEAKIQAFKTWIPLLKEVGLPTERKEIDETTKVNIRQMPIADFRKLVKIQGVQLGYWDHDIKVCLAGGSILSWINHSEVHDHDYFPLDIDEGEKFSNFLLKNGYWVQGYQGFKDQLDSRFNKEDWLPDGKNFDWYRGLVQMSNGKHLPNIETDPTVTAPEEMLRAINYMKAGNQTTRQIVMVIRGEPDEVINTFDLSITQWAIDKNNVYWGEHTIQDMVRKRCRVNRIHHPLSTIRRMVKYSQRGYFFCNGTMIDIACSLADFVTARQDAGLSPLADQVISLD
jgi:hypothetical protein